MAKKKTALVPSRKTIPTPRYRNHAYINPDGSVDGERLLKLVSKAPGAFELMMLNLMIDEGEIAPEYDNLADELVSDLVAIILLAGYGDEPSQLQLKAIEKLTQFAKYELPLTKIKDIADRYETSPSLARAWEIRRLMSYLCAVVEPKGRSVKMKDKALVSPYWADLWEAANRHVKPNTTLTSLALHLYLDQLQKEGIVDETATISEGSLKRDLKLAREWERAASEDENLRRGQHSGGSLHGDEPITWYQFSEGWKRRKLADRERKKSAKGYKDRKQLS
jgi:hypothetical protein